jgi:hypothetical protein
LRICRIHDITKKGDHPTDAHTSDTDSVEWVRKGSIAATDAASSQRTIRSAESTYHWSDCARCCQHSDRPPIGRQRGSNTREEKESVRLVHRLRLWIYITRGRRNAAKGWCKRCLSAHDHADMAF